MEKRCELLEAMPAAILMIDEAGRIVQVNSQAETLFGRAREDLLDQDVEQLLSVPERARYQLHLGDVLSHPQQAAESTVELDALRADGSDFPLEIRSSAMASESGPRILSLLRDVSEVRRYRRALHDANRLKSEFFAHMSHELRTPLNGIIGFAEFLLEGKSGELNADQHEYLGDILGSGRRLLQLINEIMELSRVEAGALELYEQRFDLRTAIDEALAQIAAAAGSKRIGVCRSVDAAVESVTLDRQRLLQVLRYILVNAVKFIDGGRELHVSATAFGEAGLSLRVWDSGAGSRTEEPEQLGDFPPTDSSAIRRFGGTGLDLILAKKILEAQDGNLSVVGERGRGNCFTVLLPHAAAACSSALAAS